MQQLEEIYQENFEIVYKYLFCLTHNENTSEELTQETFYRALKNIDNFKGECKLSTWLCQIAKNLWYDEIKKRKQVEVSLEDNFHLIEISSSSENMEERLISKENRIKLYEKMQQLDSRNKRSNLFENYRRFKF